MTTMQLTSLDEARGPAAGLFGERVAATAGSTRFDISLPAAGSRARRTSRRKRRG